MNETAKGSDPEQTELPKATIENVLIHGGSSPDLVLQANIGGQDHSILLTRHELRDHDIGDRAVVENYLGEIVSQLHLMNTHLAGILQSLSRQSGSL